MKKLFTLIGVFLLAMPFCVLASSNSNQSQDSDINSNTSSITAPAEPAPSLSSVLISSTEYTAPIDGTVDLKPEDTMTISGKSSPGARVTLDFKNDKTFTILADAEGQWTATMQSQDIPSGEQTVRASAKSQNVASKQIDLLTLNKVEEPPLKSLSLSDITNRNSWKRSPVIFGGAALLAIIIISLMFYGTIRKSKHTDY